MISCGMWSARSSDLILGDVYKWGYLERMEYSFNYHMLNEPGHYISETVTSIKVIELKLGSLFARTERPFFCVCCEGEMV
jgi:hypothetical protein